MPRRLSPSAITRYRICPRAAWFQYVAKVPRIEQPSPLLVLGNAVHAALDKFFGLKPADREPADELLGRCLRAVWRDHRTQGAFLTRDEEADYGRQGLAMLSEFACRCDTSSVPISRERWVSTRLDNGVEIFGKVDRIDDAAGSMSKELDLIDYKTGRQQLEDQDLTGEPAAQVYLIAAERQYGRPVRRVSFNYLASGATATWEVERDDVEAIRGRLVEITSSIVTDRDFEPKPGEQCARCPFAHVCPDAGRTDLADLVVPTDLDF
jgi:putative RecB family exonuclease